MKIELMVFSGRPNPKWLLLPDDLPGFPTIIGGFPRRTGPLALPQRLGYSGIVVSNENTSQEWLDITVLHEFVVVRLKDRTEYRIDDERWLENMLLATAKGCVSEALLERIRSEPQGMDAGYSGVH